MPAIKSGAPLLKKEVKKPKATAKLPVNSANSKNNKTQGKPSTCCTKTSESTMLSTNQSKEKTSLTSTLHENRDQRTTKGPITRIVVKYDVGFNNTITIRGKGANLSWDRGACLKNMSSDEWVWESDTPFTIGEFKVLINDNQYETGENHTLRCGASIQYTPKF